MQLTKNKLVPHIPAYDIPLRMSGRCEDFFVGFVFASFVFLFFVTAVKTLPLLLATT